MSSERQDDIYVRETTLLFPSKYIYTDMLSYRLSIMNLSYSRTDLWLITVKSYKLGSILEQH